MLKTIRVRSRVKLSKHCLGTLQTGPDNPRLLNGIACKNYVDDLVHRLGVTTLGDMLYPFPNHSFSLLINLAESHIAIHTWPERNVVQLDVFLCNYQRDNNEVCEEIYNKIVSYFNPLKVDTTVLNRK